MGQTISQVINLGGPPPGLEGQTSFGFTQSTAYPLVTQTTIFKTVPAGTGARLPGAAAALMTIVNNGLNPLLLWPGQGDRFYGQNPNQPYTVYPGAPVTFVSIDTSLNPAPRTWYLVGQVGATVYVVIPPADVTSTYSVSGAISLTDQLSMINAVVPVTMTVANGGMTVIQLVIHNLGTDIATITGNFEDDMSLSYVLSPNPAGSTLTLRWLPSLSTWIRIS